MASLSRLVDAARLWKGPMHRFYWLIDNVLAGCSRPGVRRGSLETDLASLQSRGIGALISLTESPLPAGADLVLLVAGTQVHK
jgi:hypothetical protein